MANFVYGKAKQNILNGNVKFSSNQFKVLFASTDYIPNESLDEFVSDIPSSAIKYRTYFLNNISNTLGTIDADDVLVTIPAQTSFNAIILYQMGATDADSLLLFYIDTANGLPYPGSENETQVILEWNNDSVKILSI